MANSNIELRSKLSKGQSFLISEQIFWHLLWCKPSFVLIDCLTWGQDTTWPPNLQSSLTPRLWSWTGWQLGWFWKAFLHRVEKGRPSQRLHQIHRRWCWHDAQGSWSGKPGTLHCCRHPWDSEWRCWPGWVYRGSSSGRTEKPGEPAGGWRWPAGQHKAQTLSSCLLLTPAHSSEGSAENQRRHTVKDPLYWKLGFFNMLLWHFFFNKKRIQIKFDLADKKGIFKVEIINHKLPDTRSQQQGGERGMGLLHANILAWKFLTDYCHSAENMT